MGKEISTYKELYQSLLLLGCEHRMYKMDSDDGIFRIKLDDYYDIAVYNDRVGEVYLEYNVKRKQLTHYHTDYQEAYEVLKEVIKNQAKELERLKKDAEKIEGQRIDV